MIDQLISELVAYGRANGLIDDADKVYVTNYKDHGYFNTCTVRGKKKFLKKNIRYPQRQQLIFIIISARQQTISAQIGL